MSYFWQRPSGFGIHLANKAKDPFEPFKDWLVDGPAGIWAEYWEEGKTLTPVQKKIVSANAKLLLNTDAWKKRVNAFDNALAQVETEEEREKKRGQYQIRFDQYEFKDSDFSQRIFPCSAGFNGATFSGYADFEKATFSGYADFVNATFSGDADFVNATFSGDAYFLNATFSGDADFVNATFSGYAYFLNATFSGDADFVNAIIRKSLFLSGAEFNSTFMSASDMKVEGNLFVNSIFRGAANFSRLEVKGTTSLSGSQFHQIPDFTDAKLDRPPDIAGMVVPQPETRKYKWCHFRRAVNSDDVVKLRKLKAMALQANDHEKDGEFFAKEMLAKRGVETTSFSGLLFNTIYWKLSEFGQSFVTPAKWMLASIYCFFCTYLGIINWQLGTYALPPSSDEKLVAFSLSVFNFLPLLGGLFRFAKTPDDHVSGFSAAYGRLAEKGLDVDLMVWLNVFQNIIGAVLLFLFL
ncbi:pentapeptide repeat-containing protein, partial [Ahrensia sp. AH-315-G08]|nr:pentapeptide repeat-containing protein [Ahrensia sp. AH-315-G08]